MTGSKYFLARLIIWIKFSSSKRPRGYRFQGLQTQSKEDWVVRFIRSGIRIFGRRRGSCPFRIRSLPFLRHLENFWHVIESVPIKKKEKRNPGSNLNLERGPFVSLGKVRFLLGGGWAGASEGRVLSNFFTNWGGLNLFYSQPGEGQFFWQGKNYSM